MACERMDADATSYQKKPMNLLHTLSVDEAGRMPVLVISDTRKRFVPEQFVSSHRRFTQSGTLNKSALRQPLHSGGSNGVLPVLKLPVPELPHDFPT